MKNEIRTFLFACLAVCASLKMNGQNIPRLGLGLDACSSGNTHGTFFSPYAGYEIGRNFVSMGLLIHKQSSMIKGAKIGFSRNLSGEAANQSGRLDLIQINFASYMQYNELLPMASFVVKEQYCVSRTPDVAWEKVQLSTAEIGAGFEVRVNLSNHICWRNTSSAAFHYHTKYAKGLSRERMGVSLALSTGLLFILP